MVARALAEQHVREFTRACVRAGLLDRPALRAEVVRAVRAELGDRAGQAAELADAWISEALGELREEESGWPEPTDYDRLQAAFTDLETAGVIVLQGVEDHWVAKELLEERAGRGQPARGIAWFTPPDVWHAVDEGMLEVNLWHGSTANAAPGDALLADVLAVLARHGLHARFDEGRIEVSARWQRRVGQL